MNRHKMYGFSLIELVIVMIIIGILSTVGLNFGVKQLASANIQTVSNDIRLISSDIENGIIELGYLTDLTDASAVRNYFAAMDWSYMTAPIDTDSIVITAAGNEYGSGYYGCSMTTKDYYDPWGSEYYIYYLVGLDDSYRIVIASAGPDGRFSPGANTAYDSNFDFENKLADDIVLVMESR